MTCSCIEKLEKLMSQVGMYLLLFGKKIFNERTFNYTYASNIQNVRQAARDIFKTFFFFWKWIVFVPCLDIILVDMLLLLSECLFLAYFIDMSFQKNVPPKLRGQQFREEKSRRLSAHFILLGLMAKKKCFTLRTLRMGCWETRKKFTFVFHKFQVLCLRWLTSI